MNQTNPACDEWQERRPVETIDGKIFMMAHPGRAHICISHNIYNIFGRFLDGKPCRAYSQAPYVKLSKKDIFVPDVLVLCDKSIFKADGYIYGAPDLVVEVLSPSTAKNDIGHKKDAYEKSGVREYWIVDPGMQFIEQYLLQDGAYILNDVYAVRPDWEWEHLTPEEREQVPTAFPCGIFPELEIKLDDVFRDFV